MTGIDLPGIVKGLKSSVSGLLEKPFIFHPFLVALLFLLREFQESYIVFSWLGLIITTLIAITLVAFILLTITFLTLNKSKTALITSAFLLLVFFYIDFKNLIFKFDPISSLIDRRHSFAMSLSVFLFTIFCSYVIFSRRQFKKLNLYLTLLFTVFIIIQVGELTVIDRITDRDYRNYFINKKHYPLTPGDPGKNPDIYYIILDSYTSSKSLKEFWQYDNSPFVHFLKQKGFFVAEDSLSPNRWTPLSMSQSLNLSPLNEFLHTLPEGTQASLMYDMLRNNKVTASLMVIGYNFQNLSLFDVAGVPRFYPDPELEIHGRGERSFPRALYDKTIFGFIRKRQVALSDFSKINLSIFERLKVLSNQKYNKPLFVYAHLNMPHWPYQFDRKGHFTPIEKLRGTLKRKDLYLEQLIYTNQLVMETINTLLSNHKSPPIIILQGDHGFRFLDGPDKERENWTILNAYFLPNKKCALSNHISPINTFRVIFNCYFGTKYHIITE